MIPPDLYAVVLAAGTARRFGATKQLARYDGQPLVRRAVRAAESVCGARTVLVLGNDWQRVHDACAPLQGFMVLNDDYESGMAGSIAAGVRAASAGASAVLLMLADQPRVGHRELRELIGAWNDSGSRIASSDHGSVTGPPTIFPAAYFNELTGLRGDRGARGVLERHPGQIVRVPCAAAAFDVDRPDDLKGTLQRPR